MPTTQTVDQGQEAGQRPEPPVFVLTTSRSGSTLLRFILDSHPDLVCPPETGVASACVQLARMRSILENAGSAERMEVHARLELSLRGKESVRTALDDAFGDYLRARGKKRWCDKSLDTYMFADVLAQVYPEARFICLVRHCMDVIASGVETCPWGLHRFGFDPYVTQYPGNSVAAIGSYWLACTNAILGFQEKYPDKCVRVRYEDLVTDPEATAARIFAHIGAEPAPGIADACFVTPHEGDGPGDEKIWFTDRVSSDSMGRGVIVPAGALPEPLRTSVNETLDKLAYRTVDNTWNAAVGTVDPRADEPVPEPAGGAEDGKADVGAVMRDITERVRTARAGGLDGILDRWPAVAGTSVGLVVQAVGGAYERSDVRFAADGAGEDADDADRPVIIAGPSSWRALLTGTTNLVSEITSGRLRVVNPNDPYRIRSEEIHAVAALLGVAQIPVARRAEPEVVAP